MYRPSCLIEAYVRPEKYWLVWAGLLANHLFNFNLIFLSDGLTAAAERAAGPADLYRCQPVHFAAMDGHRVARVALGIAWPFGCKTLQIGKSIDFKSGEYCSQSVENQNSANSH
jgi:hypothetical protein